MTTTLKTLAILATLASPILIAPPVFANDFVTLELTVSNLQSDLDKLEATVSGLEGDLRELDKKVDDLDNNWITHLQFQLTDEQDQIDKLEARKALKWLNTIGLMLGIAGVVIIFRWGPPQPDFDEGVSLGLTDKTPLSDGRTVAERAEDVKRLKHWHNVMSRVGLSLIAFGFGAQLIAVWR